MNWIYNLLALSNDDQGWQIDNKILWHVYLKVHETKHLSYEFAGTFTMEQDILHKMHVTLSVDDENKVEFFEVTNPSGQKHLFSQFEDGMVVFSHPGIAQAGIWTYHAKLYPNTGLSSTTKMTVDVVSQSNNAEAEPFMLEVLSNEQGKLLRSNILIF